MKDNNLKTEDLALDVIFPEIVSGAAVSTADGPIGLLNISADGEVLRLAFMPAEVRQLAALWLNLTEELDAYERKA
jgi:hypothetical protein